MGTRRNSRFTFGASALVTSLLAAGTALLTPTPAVAAPGDSSYAFGHFLEGSLLDLVDLNDVADIEGEEAASVGAADDGAYHSTLDLGVLGVINLDLGGGLGAIPLNTSGLGAVGQYAFARADGYSRAGAGLITDAGVVGTPDTENPPGPMSLSLASLLDDLGLGGIPVASTVADVAVTIDGVSATAEQTAGAAAVGDYSIEQIQLVVDSPLLDDIAAGLPTLAGPVDTLLTTITGALATVGGGIIVVEPFSITDLITALTDDPITDPAYPGVAVHLGTGQIIVDLGALIADLDQCGGNLSGCPANYDLLNSDVVTAIGTSAVGIVNGVLATLQDDVIDRVLGLSVSANAAPVLTLNTTLAELLDGEAEYGGLLGGALDLVLNGLLSTLGILDSAELATDLGAALLTVVTDLVAPLAAGLVGTEEDPGALAPILDALVALTVNVQEPTPPGTGQFTERALRLTVLPDTLNAANLDLANATVGGNLVGADVLDLAPDSGPETGGTAVTISGADLDAVTGVTFDGVPGTGLVHNAGGSITVTTPAHAPGLVDVVVSNAAGDTTLADAFTFLPVTVSAISLDPVEGPETGGTTVTITGGPFNDVDVVHISDIEIPVTPDMIDLGDVGEPLDDTIVFDTPPHTPGTVAVSVEITDDDPGAAGELGASEALPFTYTPVAVSNAALDPDNGPETGGTTVTITGDGLSDVTGVTIDGQDVDFTYNDGGTPTDPTDDTITIVTPPHAPGEVDVTITDPDGSTTLTYTYTPVTIEAAEIDPDNGPETGGTTVTITGGPFGDVDLVHIDGTAIPVTPDMIDVGDPVDATDDTITFTTPPHTPGTVGVWVEITDDDPTIPGQQGVSDTLDFTYTPVAVSNAALDPDNGPETGGTTVTITGDGLSDVTGVTIDGQDVDFTYNDGGTPTDPTDDTITIVTPPHAPGEVDVVITDPDGSTTLTYTYTPVAPSTSAMNPVSGPETGGTVVTITGSGFTTPSVGSVTFDGTPGTGLVVVSDTELRVTSPAHAPGPVPVVVTSPAGSSVPRTFTYTPLAPGALAADPDFGPTEGGTVVTISGTDLDTTIGISIDGTPYDTVTANPGPGLYRVNPDGTITLVTLPHPAGPVGIVVTNDGGASGPLPFTYAGIDDIDPDHGPETGGDPDDPDTWVTISGACFGTDPDAITVLFGSAEAQIVSITDTEIVVVAPPGTAGTVDVSVLGTDCGDLDEPDGYTYDFPEGEPPPDASKFVPVAPCRLLDTRDPGESKFAHDTVRTLQVGGRCEVPDEALAVSLTLTVTEAEHAGFITAWPDGDRPWASNLNFMPGDTRANGAVVRVGESGSVELYAWQNTHLVVDVSGYWVPTPGSNDGRFVGEEPVRLLDTRLDDSPFAPGETRTIALPPGVPSDAVAVAVNLTLDDSVSANFMTAWAAGEERPWASAVNTDGPHQTRAASLIVPVSSEGFSLYSLHGGTAVVDYTGYFTGESSDQRALGLFVPQAPERVIDTRESTAIAGDSWIEVDTGIPGSSVIINVTMVDTTAPNFLTVWPAGIDEMPWVSAVNSYGDPAVANLAIVGQTDEVLRIYSLVESDVVVDVAGYFFS